MMNYSLTPGGGAAPASLNQSGILKERIAVQFFALFSRQRGINSASEYPRLGFAAARLQMPMADRRPLKPVH